MYDGSFPESVVAFERTVYLSELFYPCHKMLDFHHLG